MITLRLAGYNSATATALRDALIAGYNSLTEKRPCGNTWCQECCDVYYPCSDLTECISYLNKAIDDKKRKESAR